MERGELHCAVRPFFFRSGSRVKGSKLQTRGQRARVLLVANRQEAEAVTPDALEPAEVQNPLRVVPEEARHAAVATDLRRGTEGNHR